MKTGTQTAFVLSKCRRVYFRLEPAGSGLVYGK
jgi:hypothetical protein